MALVGMLMPMVPTSLAAIISMLPLITILAFRTLVPLGRAMLVTLVIVTLLTMLGQLVARIELAASMMTPDLVIMMGIVGAVLLVMATDMVLVVEIRTLLVLVLVINIVKASGLVSLLAVARLAVTRALMTVRALVVLVVAQA